MRTLALILLTAIGCASEPPPDQAPVAAPPVAPPPLAPPPVAAPPRAEAPKIAWSAWEPATFERAKRENRLVLVHVEAVWCHWCHVMLDETYGDPRVREVVAERYLPVRVDSDARPDVAERYRDWGWPATALMTPDARPLVNLRGYQEAPQFAALLRKTADDVAAGRAVVQPPGRLPEPAASLDLAKLRDGLAAQLDGTYDAKNHGWGVKQKYPLHPPVEAAFLRTALRGETHSEESVWRDRALATLDAQTKLIDPVWGGMFQYSVPYDWVHPHFEKIATVQAAAIQSYSLAAIATGDPKWLREAERVRRYVDERMSSPDGFFTSQDADVGSHAADGLPFTSGQDFYEMDDAARRAIGEPRVDRNVYADRNGMLIAAYCAAYEAGDRRQTLDAARLAGKAIVKSHGNADGSFRHSVLSSDLLHLADQVEMGLGLLALYETTAGFPWIERARRIADEVLPRFAAPGGGYFAHTKDPSVPDAFEPRRPFLENARAARFLLRLSWVTEDPKYRASAEAAVRALAPPDVWREEGRDVGELLVAVEEMALHPVRITVVGPRNGEATQRLLRTAFATYVPGGRVVEILPQGGGGRYPVMPTPVAYVCGSGACSAPVEDPSALADEARRAARR